jgi:hypothetical protein
VDARRVDIGVGGTESLRRGRGASRESFISAGSEIDSRSGDCSPA